MTAILTVVLTWDRPLHHAVFHPRASIDPSITRPLDPMDHEWAYHLPSQGVVSLTLFPKMVGVACADGPALMRAFIATLTTTHTNGTPSFPVGLLGQDGAGILLENSRRTLGIPFSVPFTTVKRAILAYYRADPNPDGTLSLVGDTCTGTGILAGAWDPIIPWADTQTHHPTPTGHTAC